MKELITPGRLYSKMSLEFRRLRSRGCSTCILPLPHRVDGAKDAPSWVLEDASRLCEACERTIAGLVRKYQAKYDLMDPLSARGASPHHDTGSRTAH